MIYKDKLILYNNKTRYYVTNVRLTRKMFLFLLLFGCCKCQVNHLAFRKMIEVRVPDFLG